MKIFLIAVCLSTFFAIGFAAKAHAAEPRTAVPFSGENGIFLRGSTNDAYAQYFTGTSYLNMLSTEGVPIGNVTFEPGCRNVWHVHHKGGQVLLVTAGRGWYQEWGKPARELNPGDVVNIPAGVKHWHGAAKDSWFAHLAVTVPAEGAGAADAVSVNLSAEERAFLEEPYVPHPVQGHA